MMKKMSKYVRGRQQYKNKPRKVLSLEGRVQAIRMFDETPVYQRVATAFGCSWEQIKNVVLSREDILAYYARCQTIMPNDHPNQVRKKKIIFLGNAVFEYIRRAFYHKSAPLDENSIRACALKFRDAIEIEQFYPNSTWLSDFKRVFNIELPNPENVFVMQTPPAESLDCQEIISYCRSEVNKLLAERNKKKTEPTTSNGRQNENGVSSTTIHAEHSEASCNDDDNNNNDNDDENGNENEEDDDTAAEDEEGLTIDFSHYEYTDKPNSSPKVKISAGYRITSNIPDTSSMWPKKIKQERHSTSPPTTPKPQEMMSNEPPTLQPDHHSTYTPSIPPQILSSKSALAYLIPLQDYALGEEDFVAINLLANLAEHYRRHTKRRAIETH